MSHILSSESLSLSPSQTRSSNFSKKKEKKKVKNLFWMIIVEIWMIIVEINKSKWRDNNKNPLNLVRGRGGRNRHNGFVWIPLIVEN